mmetsp:Transcript_18603/g.39956  ORF Transcript_18603/g.39956 Transcript_18603/m.39956 type:complete len:200 (-) Transcript_18603:575-1174(-)|eukprot:CAMPEP_0202889828 /NCGR_PEP_ID=MMETSP1392-20130828/389_1 /ASSEMBLY_ACC=CAM_ASM_000868 /TAXON_ID=225041 /ORGANISM="Chlamydomonas chlamydogama, Strain SAG 11-48b" /LENGTH=199 /DNA_ID=CAMNT_0049573245 /DNA_START=383 /DNA_END=982 /DNA_ORIENTATION=+
MDKCCTEYEYCVSCCMDPKHDAAGLARVTARSPKNRDSGTWGEAFEYCRGVCRSHGRSTVHENAYISTRHHCFSKLGKPLLTEPLPANALDKVEVVMSALGESCDTACTKRGKQCSSKHLPYLNSCDRLREHVGCEAGCEPHSKSSQSVVSAGGLPAYLDGNAPKANRPAMCFTATVESALGCAGRDQNAYRLCSCVVP